MKIFKYKNYADYVAAQRAGFNKKKTKVWAAPENIKFICEKVLKNPTRGLCHGVRTGKEVEWFAGCLPGCEVIGTEIGDATAPHVVKWDFNKRNPEWMGMFDFIYSNSFDHSFNLSLTLSVWAEQLKPGGLMILEMNRSHEHTGEISRPVNKMDPTGIALKELVKNIPLWINGAEIIDVVNMPVVTKEWRKAIIARVR
jgi:hypothetical protein